MTQCPRKPHPWRQRLRPHARLHARVVLLSLALISQAAFSAHWNRSWQAEPHLGSAPDVTVMRWLSLGEDATAAYATLLYVQTFDNQAGANVRLRALNQDQLRAWLQLSTELYPATGYPFLLAARIYASASSPQDSRALLDWIEQRFADDPNQRWPWLAHAVWVARYELHDLGLAARYAQTLRQSAIGTTIPSWAQQLEILILASANKHEAAHELLARLIRDGQIRDRTELQTLLRSLKRPDHDPRKLEADQRSEAMTPTRR